MALMQSSRFYARESMARQVGRRNQALILLVLVLMLLFGGLGTRLVYLQVLDGVHNRQLAENNRIRLVPKPPERGRILDRKGRILAGSRLSYSVYIWPLAEKSPNWNRTLKKLSEILSVPEAEILKRVEQAESDSPFLVRIARGISPEQVTAIAEANQELEGVEIDGETTREYKYGDLAAHVLGYTGELNDDEYKRHKKEGYQLGDVIGKIGIEATYEKLLRGEGGGQQVEVDGAGKVVRVLHDKPSRPGKDLTLTIDLDLQKEAEKIMGNYAGSIVAMDPKNGAILAMVSRPAFDPNVFSKRVSEATWKRLQAADHPFLNRALQNYPPASTFKIVTTTAAIESGKYSGDEVLQTYPSITVGGVTFGEWNHAGFGPLGFTGALANSSDTFFYQIGLHIGEKPLVEWSRRFGFGQKTGIDLIDEVDPGLVPDPAWKLKYEKQEWSIGDAINMAIGQGYLLASPLQVAVMFAVPANGGYRVKPHLLKDNEEAQNWREDLHLHPKTIEILRQGLRDVVTYGTGSELDSSTVTISGKSGTAEDLGQGSHTWFGAYAPSNNPEIVVVAFGENTGGGGGSLMGPKARQVIETYFKLKHPEAAKPIETPDAASQSAPQ